MSPPSLPEITITGPTIPFVYSKLWWHSYTKNTHLPKMHSSCPATLLQSAAPSACAIPTAANNQGKACEQREDIGGKEQNELCKVELNVTETALSLMLVICC